MVSESFRLVRSIYMVYEDFKLVSIFFSSKFHAFKSMLIKTFNLLKPYLYENLYSVFYDWCTKCSLKRTIFKYKVRNDIFFLMVDFVDLIHQSILRQYFCSCVNGLNGIVSINCRKLIQTTLKEMDTAGLDTEAHRMNECSSQYRRKAKLCFVRATFIIIEFLESEPPSERAAHSIMRPDTWGYTFSEYAAAECWI